MQKGSAGLLILEAVECNVSICMKIKPNLTSHSSLVDDSFSHVVKRHAG